MPDQGPAGGGQEEVALIGGTANRGLVFRVGDTVRRPLRPTSPSTAALLDHLHDVGFDGAPRHLGVDDRGREVLTYVHGEAVVPPYPAWALTDRALLSVAALLQRYHEAVAGFDPSPHTWPERAPDPFCDGLVSHNDPNLDNVVFRDGVAVALIDFDLASPGSRVWDVAAAARLWAPLRRPADIEDGRRSRALRRLRLVADACGLTQAERAALPDAVIANHRWLYGVMRDAARHGHAGFGDRLASGVDSRADRTLRWYADGKALRDALA